MPTKVGIMNNALRLIGEPEVTDFDDTAKYPRKIRNAWTDTVNSAFEEHDWRRFISVVQLSIVAGTPVGWEYKFSLPVKFDRMIFVNNTEHRRDEGIPYEVRDGEILTNSDTTYCWYVNGTYKEQTGGWSQKFADYVAAKLAFAAYPATDEGRATTERIDYELRRRKRDAKALDRRLNPVQKVPPTEFVTARTAGIRGTRRGYWR